MCRMCVSALFFIYSRFFGGRQINLSPSHGSLSIFFSLACNNVCIIYSSSTWTYSSSSRLLSAAARQPFTYAMSESSGVSVGTAPGTDPATPNAVSRLHSTDVGSL